MELKDLKPVFENVLLLSHKINLKDYNTETVSKEFSNDYYNYVVDTMKVDLTSDSKMLNFLDSHKGSTHYERFLKSKGVNKETYDLYNYLKVLDFEVIKDILCIAYIGSELRSFDFSMKDRKKSYKKFKKDYESGGRMLKFGEIDRILSFNFTLFPCFLNGLRILGISIKEFEIIGMLREAILIGDKKIEEYENDENIIDALKYFVNLFGILLDETNKRIVKK